MKFKFYLLLLLTCYCSLCRGQVPNYITQFSNSFGGSLNEDFFAGAACADGGYLLTGFTNSSDGDIDPLLAFDTTDVFVVKCNSNGVKEWAKTFGGNAYDKARFVMEDADGNILVVGGTYSNDGDIDSTHGNGELFILKLDALGNKIWMKTYGGTGYEGGRMIHQFIDGNYLITGYTTSHNFDVPVNRGLHDGWLLKINTYGDVIWSQTYGGSGEDRMRSFIETPDGGFIYFGSSTSNDFQVSGNHGDSDYWVGKVDSLGNNEWTRLFGGSGEELAYHIIQTSDGNYLLTGSTFSNDGDVTGFHGASDGWLVKVDILGNLIWEKCFGGSLYDRLNRSFENNAGKIMTFGFAQSSDYDLTGLNNGFSQEFWLMQLDQNYNVEWSFCTGGTNTDLGEDLIFNAADSSFVLMGDSKSVNGAVLNNHGDYDFWIVKLAEFTGLDPHNGNASFTSWYDYVSQTIVADSPVNTSIDLEIIDMTGKVVSSIKNIFLLKGENRIRVKEIQDMRSGNYFVRMIYPGGVLNMGFQNID